MESSHLPWLVLSVVLRCWPSDAGQGGGRQTSRCLEKPESCDFGWKTTRCQRYIEKRWDTTSGQRVKLASASCFIPHYSRCCPSSASCLWCGAGGRWAQNTVISCTEGYLVATITFGEKLLCWRRACGIVMLITRVIVTFTVQARTCLRAKGGAVSCDNRHRVGCTGWTEASGQPPYKICGFFTTLDNNIFQVHSCLPVSPGHPRPSMKE